MTEDEVRELAEYFDNLTEEEWLAEEEEAEHREGFSWVQVPTDLMPEIRRLLYEYDQRKPKAGGKTRKRNAG